MKELLKKSPIIFVYGFTIIALYFLFMGLVKAESFLVPILTAFVLALLMLPITKKFEQWGIHAVIASLLSSIILLLIVFGFIGVLFLQVQEFVRDWEQVKVKVEQKVEELNDYLLSNTPLEEPILENGLTGTAKASDSATKKFSHDANKEESEQDEWLDKAGQHALLMVGGLFRFMATFLIIFVYVFLFIHFRKRFKNFILRFFPLIRRPHVEETLSKCATVSRRYLAGRLLLMIALSILYYAGMMISGLENALFISIIAAALSFIPFVGNLIGYAIAMLIAVITNGDSGMLLGITLTFTVTQFVETYILQPIILGDKLDVHPAFIIISVILGNEIWGIMGMVLSIPLFGMITVICKYVPQLHPFGYLFSKKEINEPWDNK
jgi:predicted PurR-regulated permease PerM